MGKYVAWDYEAHAVPPCYQIFENSDEIDGMELFLVIQARESDDMDVAIQTLADAIDKAIETALRQRGRDKV